MTKISIFTSMTNPEERMDPWKEAMECYKDFADEVVVVGKDWPYEFKWDHIGKTFNDGFKKSSGDWVIRMDLDYFFMRIHLKKLEKTLINMISTPQFHFHNTNFLHQIGIK